MRNLTKRLCIYLSDAAPVCFMPQTFKPDKKGGVAREVHLWWVGPFLASVLLLSHQLSEFPEIKMPIRKALTSHTVIWCRALVGPPGLSTGPLHSTAPSPVGLWHLSGSCGLRSHPPHTHWRLTTAGQTMARVADSLHSPGGLLATSLFSTAVLLSEDSLVGQEESQTYSLKLWSTPSFTIATSFTTSQLGSSLYKPHAK
ncbi:unnamed protein product [Trypanosoma congolense IL3000]|uniref:WGS project CAEQ00000000 data, annotated contig 2245 n=1 Tax=Trypanosoma congolense (strain IL3000) TaxID=1068625 RepID=F9WCL5_TRYCI|nr:unnamed protein product [Trypanosoma congolense IL3000]